jgi:hypothetical protein
MQARHRAIAAALFLAPLLASSLAHAAPAQVAAGSYECWGNGSPRMLLNFTVKGPGQYVGSDDKPGRYAYDAATGAIRFQGGALDGVMPAGFTSVYHEDKGRPTVSFRSGRGAEASFCEKVGR